MKRVTSAFDLLVDEDGRVLAWDGSPGEGLPEAELRADDDALLVQERPSLRLGWPHTLAFDAIPDPRPRDLLHAVDAQAVRDWEQRLVDQETAPLPVVPGPAPRRTEHFLRDFLLVLAVPLGVVLGLALSAIYGLGA